MKLLKFIIVFALLLSMPISLIVFLYSPKIQIIEPIKITYELSPQAGLSGSVTQIPSEYLRFEKVIQKNWNPSIKNKEQKFILDTKDPRRYYFQKDSMEYSADTAYEMALGEFNIYKIRSSEYKISFEYNPAKNTKNVRIIKINEKGDNYNALYFIILLFTWPILPISIVYFLYYFTSKRLINRLSVQLISKGEFILQAVFKNFAGIGFLTLLQGLANIFYVLGIGYIAAFEGFRIEPFDISRMFTPITLMTIFQTIMSLILIYYYDLFLVVTSKRILEVKSNKINKELSFKDIYRVEDSPASSDIGGGIKIISNKKYDISINMAGDPLVLKNKIMGLVNQYKKENNTEVDTPTKKYEDEIKSDQATGDNMLLKIQMMADSEYAKSVAENLIVETLVTPETELPDVRYCQYCGAEFPANETRCPICEKLNE